MSSFNRPSLMKFLNKPRCLREIIKHFEVPTKVASYHLQEAIKSGDVLVYGKQKGSNLPNLNAKQPRLERFFYVSKNSLLFIKGPAAPCSILEIRDAITNEKPQSPRRSPTVHSRKVAFLRNLIAYLKPTQASFSEVLQNDLSSKMKLTKSRKRIPKSNQQRLREFSRPKSLLHVERIRLFQELSSGSLPFLDIHGRFGVSKQMVERFVKRGFFEEEWGPRNIGVRFKLTRRGEAYLRRLEKASNLENQQRRKIFIHLKHWVAS